MSAAWFAALGIVSAAPEGASHVLRTCRTRARLTPPAELWRVPLPGPVVPSAVHTELGGPTISGPYVYVGSAGADALFVLDRRTGRMVRELPAGAPWRRPRSSMPVISLLRRCGLLGLAADPELRDIPRWTHSGSAPVLATPLVTDDRIYIATVTNVVYALDRRTGELVWRHAQKLDPGRSAELELYGAPTPTLVGELLVTGFSDGTLVGLTAAAGELVWQRRVGEGQYPDIMGAARPHGTDVVVAGHRTTRRDGPPFPERPLEGGRRGGTARGDRWWKRPGTRGLRRRGSGRRIRVPRRRGWQDALPRCVQWNRDLGLGQRDRHCADQSRADAGGSAGRGFGWVGLPPRAFERR